MVFLGRWLLMDKTNGPVFNSVAEAIGASSIFVRLAKRKQALLESNLPGICLMDQKQDVSNRGSRLPVAA